MSTVVAMPDPLRDRAAWIEDLRRRHLYPGENGPTPSPGPRREPPEVTRRERNTPRGAERFVYRAVIAALMFATAIVLIAGVQTLMLNPSQIRNMTLSRIVFLIVLALPGVPMLCLSVYEINATRRDRRLRRSETTP